jgi:hypothetical protein
MHSLDKQGYNLQISKFIHFGNSLVQLTNAIDLAKRTKSLLMLPNIGTCNEAYEFLSRLPNFSYTDGVGCNETLESKFYFKDECFGHTITNDTRREILQSDIHDHLEYEDFDLDDDELVIHIRSGNIFGGWVHKNYAQPPMSFYDKVISEAKPNKIVIVTEDYKNPCVKGILNKYENSFVVHSNLKHSIGLILSAKKLVIGFGTFGWMQALLSKNIHTLWCPNVCTDIFDTEFENGDPFKIVRHVFEDYIDQGEWVCSQEQLELMMGEVNVVEVI